MDSFNWDHNFETGLSEVDRQHHHLVDLLNRFGARMAENDVSSGHVEDLFAELAEYARYHFREEEQLMARVGVDPRHIDRHVDAHNSFLQEVSAMHVSVDWADREGQKQLLNFLIQWLVYHILGQDRSMAKQILAIESGLQPAAAYDVEEVERDAAMGPLVTALNKLFNLISARNRELLQLNQTLEAKVAERTRELSEANRHLEMLSRTDVLTGLPNRRHAMRRLVDLWQESVEFGTPLACVMIDADHFKAINDTWGHDAGDEVLCELAKTLRDSMRNDDVVCRLGGDEFFAICPDTDLDGGVHIAEQTRARVAALCVPTGDGEWKGSISVGVAARNPGMESFEQLIKLADDGVYAAKRAGKNCVRAGS